MTSAHSSTFRQRLFGGWRKFVDSKIRVVALVFLATIVVLAVLAPVLPIFDPSTPDMYNILHPPSVQHVFGTDSLGRDVFSRFVYGARVPLEVGFVSGLLMTLMGIGIGVVAGYEGKYVDEVSMRATDIFLILPALPLILTITLVFGGGIYSIIFVISILSWPPLARIIRAETLSIAKRDFVLAERILGASKLRIWFIHIVPNEVPSIMAYLSLGIAGAILTDSAIDFLGLAPISLSWGFDVSTALSYWLVGAWWLVVFPGMGIALTCLCFFIMSEAISK
jgi:peptide/nickel transport system permease protein